MHGRGSSRILTRGYSPSVKVVSSIQVNERPFAAESASGTAELFSARQATLHALVMHLHSLEVITLSLNEMILADTHSGKFLSCFMGLVDTRKKGLHYINAGHCPPLLVRKTGEVLQMDKGGMVIGLFSAVDYERGSMDLKAGDIIVRVGTTKIKNIYDYTFVLGELKAGEEVEVEVLRGGQRLVLKVVPESRR